MLAQTTASVAVKRLCDYSNSSKENIPLSRLSYSFKSSFHSHHIGEHGSKRANVAFEE